MAQPDDNRTPSTSPGAGGRGAPAIGPADRSGRLPAPQAALGWDVEVTAGTAGWFHDRDPEPDPGHRVCIHHTQGPALVLGSGQNPALIRAEAAGGMGIEVCRRRSGGGLVYIQPRYDLWIDVVIPRQSPLWDDDVGRSFHWLGRHWARVLEDHYRYRLDRRAELRVATETVRRPEGKLLCFADVGHGEVLWQHRKLVGLSQRRTRRWARLQGLFAPRPRHRDLLALLEPELLPEVPPMTSLGSDDVAGDAGETARGALPPEQRLALWLDGVDRTVGLPDGVARPDRSHLVESFCRNLPPI